MATKVKSNSTARKSTRSRKSNTKEEALIQRPVDGETVPDVVREPMTYGQIEGDMDMSDLKMPRLDMVHGVGELSKTFNPGDLVYNECLVLAEKGTPIFLSVLSGRKYYRESLPYDPDREEMPRLFGSAAEAEAAGLSTSWQDNRPPDVDKVAEFRIVIEAPEGLDTSAFPLGIEADGKEYFFAPAVWRVSRTAYGPVARQVFSAAALTLKNCLPAGRWKLNTVREERNGNVITLPVFRQSGRYPDAVVEFFNTSVNWEQA